MFKSKKIIISTLSTVTLGLASLSSPSIAETSNHSPAPNQSEKSIQQQTNIPSNMNQSSAKTFKRQAESDSVSGKTNDTHNHWTKNLTGEKFTTIAHRGASGYAPEHTFEAYDKSHNELGASYIEIDLQRTKDGHLVAMHDEKVNRTTNGHGCVDQLTLKELKQLDAGSWFNRKHPEYAKNKYKNAKVPTLDEILNRYGKNANYYIETKSPDVYPGMEEQLLASLKKHHLLNNNKLKNGHVMIQSFSDESLKKIHRQNKHVPLVKLVDKGELQQFNDQRLKEIRSYAIGLGPDYTDLTEQNTHHLKDLGFIVHPYTVNEKADMLRLNKYGVDGVFTNFADKYKEVIK